MVRGCKSNPFNIVPVADVYFKLSKVVCVFRNSYFDYSQVAVVPPILFTVCCERGTEGGWAGDRGEGLAPIICASLWPGRWDNDVCSSSSCSYTSLLLS